MKRNQEQNNSSRSKPRVTRTVDDNNNSNNEATRASSSSVSASPSAPMPNFRGGQDGHGAQVSNQTPVQELASQNDNPNLRSMAQLVDGFRYNTVPNCALMAAALSAPQQRGRSRRARARSASATPGNRQSGPANMHAAGLANASPPQSDQLMGNSLGANALSIGNSYLASVSRGVDNSHQASITQPTRNISNQNSTGSSTQSPMLPLVGSGGSQNGSLDMVRASNVSVSLGALPGVGHLQIDLVQNQNLNGPDAQVERPSRASSSMPGPPSGSGQLDIYPNSQLVPNVSQRTNPEFARVLEPSNVLFMFLCGYYLPNFYLPSLWNGTNTFGVAPIPGFSVGTQPAQRVAVAGPPNQQPAINPGAVPHHHHHHQANVQQEPVVDVVPNLVPTTANEVQPASAAPLPAKKRALLMYNMENRDN